MNRNAVDHSHAAGSQQAPHRPAIGWHGSRVDMFQHADRYDPVELASRVAIVAQCKIQPAFKAVLGCGFPRIVKVALRQVIPVTDRFSRHSVIVKASPPQPHPISRTLCPSRRFSLAASRASLVS